MASGWGCPSAGPSPKPTAVGCRRPITPTAAPRWRSGCRSRAWDAGPIPRADRSDAAMPDMTPTVFVVDDDASFCRAVERLLHSFGHRVETFASPMEFIARARPDEPGCVILDMRMPELPGIEVQRMVTAAGLTMPIIFVSGSADVESCV